MADGYVQVATDGSGKKIDNAELTREPETVGSAGVVVERQRVVLSDDGNARLQTHLSGEVGSAALVVDAKTFAQMAHELTRIRELLEFVVGG